MKIYNIKNVEKFMKVIDSCKGKVMLVTSEGDQLNLKSKLTQYVALSNYFSSETSIPELELVAYESDDAMKLVDYMLTQEI